MGYDQKQFCHGRGAPDYSRETLGPYRDCPSATQGVACPEASWRGSFDRAVSSKSLVSATDVVITYGISMAGMSFVAVYSSRKAAADSGKS
jgi:hypothetical protein